MQKIKKESPLLITVVLNYQKIFDSSIAQKISNQEIKRSNRVRLMSYGQWVVVRGILTL